MATSKIPSGKDLGVKLTDNVGFVRIFEGSVGSQSAVDFNLSNLSKHLVLVSAASNSITHGLYILSTGSDGKVDKTDIKAVEDSDLSLSTSTGKLTAVNANANRTYMFAFFTLNGTL